mmetsp:Transcript_15833/g.37358  ORF Transcript_15833/g.37358 Transcript_15833/m.37358 type:complete len:222 (-) Transcript_15833:1458-2123(-)
MASSAASEHSRASVSASMRIACSVRTKISRPSIMASPSSFTLAHTSSVQRSSPPAMSAYSASARAMQVALSAVVLNSWQAAHRSAAARYSASERITPKARSFRPLFFSSSLAWSMQSFLIVELHALAASATTLRWYFFNTSSICSSRPALPLPFSISARHAFMASSVSAASMQTWKFSPRTSTAASSLARFSLCSFLSLSMPLKSSSDTSAASTMPCMQRS